MWNHSEYECPICGHLYICAYPRETLEGNWKYVFICIGHGAFHISVSDYETKEELIARVGRKYTGKLYHQAWEMVYKEK